MSFNGDLYPSAGADVVMTTKGDMVDFNTARQRLAIGSANQILQVKSSLPSWETLSTAGSVLTTQGDVLYEGAAGLARLGFGTSGDVLTTKGTGANPVWETPSGGGQIELIATANAGVPTGRNSLWNSGTLTPEPNMETTYSELIVIANLYYDEATGFGECYINLNSTTSNYGDAHGYYYDGTTMTQLSKSNGTTAFITDANLGESTNEGIHTYTSIALNDATTFMYNFHTYSTSSSGTSMILDTTCDLASNTIDHVKLQASLASWQADSNITIYGRKMI